MYPQWVTVQFACSGTNIWLDTIGERVVYRGITYGDFIKFYKRVRRYPSMSLSPGTDTEKPWGMHIEWIAKWSHSFYISSYSCYP